MTEPTPLAPDTLAMLAEASTGTLTTILIQQYGLRFRTVQGVEPLNRDNARFVGEAYTIRFVPIREDLADIGSPAAPTGPNKGMIDGLPAGAVVMIDAQRETACGVMGDVLVSRMLVLGVKGLVTDGGIRDGDVLSDIALPVVAGGRSAPPSFRALMCVGCQEIIGCGGVMVTPGDIVVGDGAGVVVIPRHLADEIAPKARDKEVLEGWVKVRIERGEPLEGLYPPREKAKAEYQAWLDAGRPAQ